MNSYWRPLILSVIISAFIVSCNSPDTLYDLGGESHSLLNSDSTAVDFPNDYNDQYTVVTFIYTSCPDVCTVITANMKNIQNELADTSGVRFVEISFDPERDLPSTLKEYKELYRLNDQFSLLTGDTANVNTLLDRLDIVAEKTEVDTQKGDTSQYMMKHSNKIYLMGKNGRIYREYPASVTPPEHIAEDLQKLR